jgi:hypothetical protein
MQIVRWLLDAHRGWRLWVKLHHEYDELKDFAVAELKAVRADRDARLQAVEDVEEEWCDDALIDALKALKAAKAQVKHADWMQRLFTT